MQPELESLISLHLWPQYRVLVDFYKPRDASILLPAVAALDDESARVTVKLQAMDAREEVGRTRN